MRSQRRQLCTLLIFIICFITLKLWAERLYAVHGANKEVFHDDSSSKPHSNRLARRLAAAINVTTHKEHVRMLNRVKLKKIAKYDLNDSNKDPVKYATTTEFERGPMKGASKLDFPAHRSTKEEPRSATNDELNSANIQDSSSSNKSEPNMSTKSGSSSMQETTKSTNVKEEPTSSTKVESNKLTQVKASSSSTKEPNTLTKQTFISSTREEPNISTKVKSSSSTKEEPSSLNEQDRTNPTRKKPSHSTKLNTHNSSKDKLTRRLEVKSDSSNIQNLNSSTNFKSIKYICEESSKKTKNESHSSAKSKSSSSAKAQCNISINDKPTNSTKVKPSSSIKIESTNLSKVASRGLRKDQHSSTPKEEAGSSTTEEDPSSSIKEDVSNLMKVEDSDANETENKSITKRLPLTTNGPRQTTTPKASTTLRPENCSGCFPISMSMFLLTSKEVCEPVGNITNISLLIYIASKGSNEHQRNAIRQSWGQLSENNTSPMVRHLFVLARETEEVDAKVKVERDQYRDIVLLDYQDKYRLLTIKTVFGLKWMLEFCPSVQFVMKTDDDVFININTVFRVAREKAVGKTLVGLPILNSHPIRDKNHKFHVSYGEYPQPTFAPYTCGAGYLMNRYLAREIVKVVPSTPFLAMEDAYIGLCLQKVNGKVINAPSFVHFYSAVVPVKGKECELWRNPTTFVLHGVSPETLINEWNACSNDILVKWNGQ